MSESKDAQFENNESTPSPHTPTATSRSMQLEGWRRTLVLLSVFIGLFLSFLDTTIVSVALATIANEFDDFDHASKSNVCIIALQSRDPTHSRSETFADAYVLALLQHGWLHPTYSHTWPSPSS